jgi:hypothetical protein
MLLIDFSREFFQLSQNPIIGNQWLTAKRPTAKAHGRLAHFPLFEAGRLHAGCRFISL